MVDEDTTTDDQLQCNVASIMNIEVVEFDVTYVTQCIRCSVHTFQLCVESGLKDYATQKLLAKARKVKFIILVPTCVWFYFNT